MADEDPYHILQVDPSAVAEVIEAAYRALARKLHPDRNPATDAGAAMARLNRAYDILRDPLRREALDRERARSLLAVASRPAPPANPGERRPRRHAAETGRAWSPLLLLLPFFLLAGAALALLVLLGPLGAGEVRRTGEDRRVGQESPRAGATTVALSGLDPEDESQETVAQRLLTHRGALVLEQRKGDVTGDGVAELLVLAAPAGCSPPCLERTILVVAAPNRYWEIDRVHGSTIGAISLSPPGFELLLPLQLTSDNPCCPSTARIAVHRWNGEGFSLVGIFFDALNTEAQSPAELVRRHYALAAGEAMLPAYGLLSRRYQEAHPFEAWASTITMLKGFQVESLREVGGDMVEVTLVDGASGSGGLPRRFKGQWLLIRTPRGWRLDRETLAPQP